MHKKVESRTLNWAVNGMVFGLITMTILLPILWEIERSSWPNHGVSDAMFYLLVAPFGLLMFSPLGAVLGLGGGVVVGTIFKLPNNSFARKAFDKAVYGAIFTAIFSATFVAVFGMVFGTTLVFTGYWPYVGIGTPIFEVIFITIFWTPVTGISLASFGAVGGAIYGAIVQPLALKTIHYTIFFVTLIVILFTIPFTINWAVYGPLFTSISGEILIIILGAIFGAYGVPILEVIKKRVKRSRFQPRLWHRSPQNKRVDSQAPQSSPSFKREELTLVNYIKQARAKGMVNHQITLELTNNGWTIDSIAAAFKEEYLLRVKDDV